MTSILTSNDIVYVDTMTFVYQLVSASHPLNAKAQQFFTDIQNQKFKALTSTFVKTEFLAVMKRLLADKLQAAPNQTTIDAMWNRFEQFISSMGIAEYDSDNLAKDCKLFSDSHNRVKQANPVRGNDGKWRILNGADSLHLVFAERVPATKFMTNDDGFKTSNSAVQTVILREEYP